MALKSNVLLTFWAVGVCSGSANNKFPENTFGKGPGEAFVHLFEWSWDDIAKECEDWLGPKGYTAVQISPPSEHQLGDGWNTRYKPVTYNKFVSRSGNESQLKSMIRRCADAGVDIYADIVINQMADEPGTTVGTAGTAYSNRHFGDQFGPEDFHHVPESMWYNCGVSNYTDERNVQNCDLLGMPDVCTGCPKTQDKIAQYINRLASMGVKGIRIDAAKHQNSTELGQLFEKINPNLYRFLEVIANYGEAVQPPEYYPLGQVTEFHLAFNLAPKFTEPNSFQADLTSLTEHPWFMPSAQAVTFLDNHDTQRDNAPLIFQRDTVHYVMATVYLLAWPYGYPKVMSSYYFTDHDEGPPGVAVHGPHGKINCGDGINWVCEHRSTAIANMVNWRKSAGDAPVTHFNPNGNTLSFCRGDKACVAINKQSAPWRVTLQTDMPEGYYCDVSQSDDDDCPSLEVKEDGTVDVVVPRMSTLAFHVGKRPGGASAMSMLSGPSVPRSVICSSVGLLSFSIAIGMWVSRSFCSQANPHESGVAFEAMPA